MMFFDPEQLVAVDVACGNDCIVDSAGSIFEDCEDGTSFVGQHGIADFGSDSEDCRTSVLK